MYKYLIISLTAGFLSCSSNGGEDLAAEKVNFKDAKDSLSYCLGAEQAKMITESGDPNLNKLDFDAIIAGFKDGLNMSDQELTEECRPALMKLYGPYGQDFDSTAVGAGSLCIGKMAGSVFANGWKKKDAMSQINMEMAKIGFRHGLNVMDTLIPQAQRMLLVSQFAKGINTKAGDKMMADAKALPNTRVLDNGIVIQTLEAGKGGSPNMNDDVVADYTLTNAYGDTIESSVMMRQQRPDMPVPAFNLGGVIQGWTQAFPNLKKGGKYRLFIPWDLAYGAQGGYESLCFLIDFQDFGPAGSLAKQQGQF